MKEERLSHIGNIAFNRTRQIDDFMPEQDRGSQRDQSKSETAPKLSFI
jgi:hypothetical protein